MQKAAIIIPCYNRLSYLKQTVWSLYNCDLSAVDEIIFINDASTDKATNEFIDSLITKPKTRIVVNRENKGIKGCLIYGYELCFANGYDIVINFDSDAIIRSDCITQLIENYKQIPGTLLTAFHSTTKNANGSERHFIIEEALNICYKRSVGGINFCIDKQAYEQFVKPALNSNTNWDHQACINSGGAYCLKPSLVQHIGFDSSLNHTEQPDIADDFYYWDLPSVTLLGVDNQPERLNRAKEICTKWIKFGEVVTLNPDIRSKEAYSEFMIKEAYKYVKTTHCLIFQHDGYVNNWMAWDNVWLQYDYIGAPWHYQDGMAVGNGGFSLRSRRLMEIIATDTQISFTHPEDHHICRTYRPYLEQTYGIKFAPLEVAEKFSFEGYMQPNKVLKDQFGVHGSNPRKAAPIVRPVKQKYVIGQFASLGDILWLVPLVRALNDEGNETIWPVNPEYLSLRKHFPDLNFIDKNLYNLPYESRNRIMTPYGQWLPYRYASENMGRTLRDCMESKYSIYGHSWKIFRSLHWERDRKAEQSLYDKLIDKKPYIIVNRYYGAQGQFQITPELPLGANVIEMKPIEGFTMLDWGMVIENASEIHTANTSILYMLEQMRLDMPIHLYSRNGLWSEKAFEYTQFIHSKPYQLHI